MNHIRDEENKNIRDEENKNIRDEENMEMININHKLVIISISIMFIFSHANVTKAINEKDLVWSSGNTYRMTPSDNMVTEGDYSIKAVEFPPPVRGFKNINGSIVPEDPMIPFVKFEIYKDIVNNSKPIDTFALGIGDYYITQDQEKKISIDDIPGPLSQDWVYEYYNPWISIRIQKRAVPTLDIDINLDNMNNESLDEANIKTGDMFKIIVNIKNTGEDIIKNLNYNIDVGSLIIKSIAGSDKSKDTIDRLNVNDLKTIEMTVTSPVSIDPNEYNIQVNSTGYDTKDLMYYFNNSHNISTRGAIDYVYAYKYITKNTSYKKESVHVILNVVNNGPIGIGDIQLSDTIPEKLQFLKNNTLYDLRELSFNKSSIGPDDSWSIEYNLMPVAPGVYVLPIFSVNFSMGGRKFNMMAAEVGFRIFGPVLSLSKSVTDTGDGLEVKVVARNIGNGFASKVSIKDQLPQNATIISGDVNLTTSLDAGTEKSMSYIIKMPKFENISAIIWPPAKVTYYLDDYKFNTSSDEKIVEGTVGDERQPQGGSGVHEILMPITVVTAYPIVTIPPITENPKEVVATIPVKTPIQTTEKSIPGFKVYESLFSLLTIIILSGILLKKRNKR